MFTIEDYLELLTGIKESRLKTDFAISKSDFNLLTSLARQVFKGIALTDRQFNLAKIKLLEYKDQFESNGFENIEIDFDNLRMPLRSIDRSKWIKIVDYPGDMIYESYKTHSWIAVRFIFNKKLISVIDVIKSTDKDAIYDKENKIHYFALTEKNIYNIINALKDKNFEIDPLLQEKYEIIKSMHDNKNNYIPGIYGFKLKNLNANALDYIVSDIGDPDKNNLALFKDRDDLYGLEHFDQNDLNASINQLTILSQKIVRRQKNTILINKNTYNFDRVAESILELHRFPLLIVLNPNNDFDELVQTYQSFANIISTVSVLYRKDNIDKEGKEFNQYISDNELNQKLDSNPKIVYIKDDKFPKTLLKSNWKPSAAIIFGSRSLLTNSKLQSYIGDLDLIIHYDSEASPFMLNTIEKI